jgi:D-sedoheptulose 7-phosphate isomerase
MELHSLVRNEFLEGQRLLERFLTDDQYFIRIGEASTMMADSIQNGSKIISCGNGGSHCDAMHFAEELTGRFRANRRPLPALAIADPSYLTCVGNDFGFSEVFSRFIEAIGQANDVLLAITTSGQSESILKAVRCARSKAMKVVLLTGNDGGKMKGEADIEICVPHIGFADRIQEIHIKIIHSLILSIEQLILKPEA